MSIHKRTYRRKDGRESVYYLAVVKQKGLSPIAKQFERKVDAEKWEREKRVLLETSTTESFKDQTMTMSELSSYWVETFARKRLEWSSVEKYEGILKNYILPSFGTRRLMEISPAEAEKWLHELLSKHEMVSKTANGCLGLFKKMLNDALHWRMIPYNPVGPVRFLSEEERDFSFWTIDEAEKFLVYAKEHDLPTYYAVSISLYTGMRLGEIQGLKWDSVDFTSKQITVKRTFCLKEGRLKERTKTKKIRRIPMNSSLQEIFIELRNLGSSEHVLPQFDFHRAALIVRRLAKKAGVRPIRFHDLRHSFASNFVMQGGEIYKLQRLLGHTSIQMTERYSHLSPDHLSGATELLNFGTKKRENVVALCAAGNDGD